MNQYKPKNPVITKRAERCANFDGVYYTDNGIKKCPICFSYIYEIGEEFICEKNKVKQDNL
jgi:hypothetical protein